MKKTFCDRCGKEIKYGAIISKDNVIRLNITKSKFMPFVNEPPQNIDLCEECHAAVYNFIFNNKEKPTESEGE